jgi:hypothetical protein
MNETRAKSTETPRRALVYCSFGDNSTVGTWIHQPGDFDVALVYFGTGSMSMFPRAKFSMSNRGLKFPNFCQLIDRYPEMLDYDYFCFVDDDLIIPEGTFQNWINAMITNQLDLAQPSLTRQSEEEWRWPHLINVPGKELEYGQFVECQCFCLSQAFLRRVLPFFYMVKSGIGIDVVFFRLMDLEKWRTAIIHSIQVYHPPRPEHQTVRANRNQFVAESTRIMQRLDFCFDTTVNWRNMRLATASGRLTPGVERLIGHMLDIKAALKAVALPCRKK